MEPQRPVARSLYGMLILIFGLSGYAFLVSAVGEMLFGSHIAVQFIYYFITGVVWIFPVKKLLRWMAAAYKE
jgi:Protein of unknown function (DUF2842)